MAVCSVPTLIEEACANGFMTAANDIVVSRALKLQLDCNLASTGTGGGAALETNGDPNGVLAGGYLQFAYDPATDSLYIHKGVAGTNTSWYQLI